MGEMNNQDVENIAAAAEDVTAQPNGPNSEQLHEDDDADLREFILSQVPEHLRALAPVNLNASDLAKWATKAQETAKANAPSVPPTDGGRKPSITPRTIDPESLSAVDRIAAGYSSMK